MGSAWGIIQPKDGRSSCDIHLTPQGTPNRPQVGHRIDIPPITRRNPAVETIRLPSRFLSEIFVHLAETAAFTVGRLTSMS
jgi:hypothetical protein